MPAAVVANRRFKLGTRRRRTLLRIADLEHGELMFSERAPFRIFAVNIERIQLEGIVYYPRFIIRASIRVA